MGDDAYYWIFGTDENSLSELSALGFVVGNFSTDGDLVCVDKGDQEIIDMTDVPTKPAYCGGNFPNWPRLDCCEARQLTKITASEKGASDGWRFNRRAQAGE